MRLMSGSSTGFKTAVIGLQIVAALSLLPAWGDDTYTLGKSAYKSGQFEKAQQYFTQATRQNPENAEAWFYIGLCATRNNDYKAGREAFEHVIQMVPASTSIAAKARTNLSYITKTEMEATGNSAKARVIVNAAKQSTSNYLGQAISDGKVKRWDTAKMPLRVYITDGKAVPGWSSGMKDYVRKAMSTWQAATANKVRFVETMNPQQSDIIVNWKQMLPHNRIGENPFVSRADTIVRSDVTVALYASGTQQPLSAHELQNTTIHELGHALGIQGHSPYPEDIMYFGTHPSQGNTLTARDKNTIQLIYKMDADVQNSSTLSTAQTRDYFDLIDAGRKIEAANPSQAAAYYRKAVGMDRQNIVGKYYLGTLLINQGVSSLNSGKREQAKREFSEAVTLLQEVSGSPKAPSNTKQNLATAQKNLTIASR